MSKFFETVMEIINWLLIFISPFLVFSIIAVIIYFNNPESNWLPLGLFAIGIVLGIILAERIRRKYGTTTYMGRLRGNAEFIDEQKEDDEAKK